MDSFALLEKESCFSVPAHGDGRGVPNSSPGHHGEAPWKVMRQFQVPLEHLKNYWPEPRPAQTNPDPGPDPHWNCFEA
jgi:hypothetical protein